ncbi:MAG: NAD(P)-dependent oxidoreductase [Myxococcales bacterium]|nr:NAD(P)-dependent oxidoreductase [Myxococcales bacterium]
MKVLVTGSSGLVGRALLPALERAGHTTVPFDLVDGSDVRDSASVRAALSGCDGVVHLAAVSRVAWGQTDPDRCRSVNEGGTHTVMQEVRSAATQPFVLFASSREVYGEPDALPVSEDAPLEPLNVYARTKVAGEQMVGELGGRGAVVRLCNVYGDVLDHPDRVIPAFVRAACADAELRVEGRGHLFDFTHVRDVARALVASVESLHEGRRLRPMHLASGRGTTLAELARLAMGAGGGGHTREAPPRTYDVSRFVGDPSRASTEVGWRPSTALEDGLVELAGDLRDQRQRDTRN